MLPAVGKIKGTATRAGWLYGSPGQLGGARSKPSAVCLLVGVFRCMLYCNFVFFAILFAFLRFAFWVPGIWVAGVLFFCV